MNKLLNPNDPVLNEGITDQTPVHMQYKSCELAQKILLHCRRDLREIATCLLSTSLIQHHASPCTHPGIKVVFIYFSSFLLLFFFFLRK